jgi:hypothetical protein
MEQINNFGFAKLRNNFNNFKLFVNNMLSIGYNYQSNPDQVNTILAYLTKLGFEFIQYRSDSLAQNIIMSLFKYSSRTDYSQNGMKDILDYQNLDLDNIEWRGYKSTTWLFQAIANQITILAKRNKSNFIDAYKSDIMPFFYEDEEFNRIVNKSQFSDSEIVSIMKSISGGIKNYGNSLDRRQTGVIQKIEILDVIRIIIDMYPYAVFQFLTMNILSNPTNAKSKNRVAVNKHGANKKYQFRR